jgi:hypothetical protein
MFRGIFNGLSDDTDPEFTIYKYDYAKIIELGAVKYRGLHPHTIIPRQKYVNVLLLYPQKLRGQDSELEIYFEQRDRRQPQSCFKIQFTPLNVDANVTYDMDLNSMRIKIPKEWQVNGYFNFNLKFPGIAPWDPRKAPLPSECEFHLKGVDVFPIQ